MKAVAVTDTGRRMKVNEDCYRIKELKDAVFGVVCDGVGGGQAGELASSVAADAMIRSIEELYRKDMTAASIKNMLSTAAGRANLAVLEEAGRNPATKGMATTMVAALMTQDCAYVVHAGDSRAYLLEKDGVLQVTKDHTMARYLLEQGEIGKEEYENYPNKNIITRAVGAEQQIELDYNECYLQPGERLLLCSDGLYKYVKDPEIFELSKQKNSVRAMVDLAIQRGGSDNITVLMLG